MKRIYQNQFWSLAYEKKNVIQGAASGKSASKIRNSTVPLDLHYKYYHIDGLCQSIPEDSNDKKLGRQVCRIALQSSPVISETL
jgi:hypothetical protein